MPNVFTSQWNIKNKQQSKIDYATDNLFAGIWRLDQSNLERFDPFVGGYAFIIWTKLPAFFEADMKSQFQALTEKNFKSFQGIGDISLTSDNITHGFTGNELPVVTSIQKENTSFTLKAYELAGSPIRELYQYWVTGMRDPDTGLAHYHGAIESGKLEYSMKNHTGELLYIVTDPSGAVGSDARTGIEFAAYYTNVFPTKIPQDHLNYSSGDHGLTEIDIEFKGNYHQSQNINAMAAEAMKYYAIKKRFGSYELGPTVETSLNRGYKDNATY